MDVLRLTQILACDEPPQHSKRKFVAYCCPTSCYRTTRREGGFYAVFKEHRIRRHTEKYKSQTTKQSDEVRFRTLLIKEGTKVDHKFLKFYLGW